MWNQCQFYHSKSMGLHGFPWGLHGVFVCFAHEAWKFHEVLSRGIPFSFYGITWDSMEKFHVLISPCGMKPGPLFWRIASNTFASSTAGRANSQQWRYSDVDFRFSPKGATHCIEEGGRVDLICPARKIQKSQFCLRFIDCPIGVIMYAHCPSS